jgi:hypothetical protein
MMFVKRLTPLALVLTGIVLQAQETTTTLVGTVTTKKGRAIPGAVVNLSSPAMLGNRTAVTDAKGNYRVPLLPNGTYHLSISCPTYVSVTATFPIQAGQVLRKDGVLLSMKEVEETMGTTVEVVGVTTPLQVDKTEAVTQSVFSENVLEMIRPTDVYSVMNIAPGVTENSGESSSVRGGANAGFKILQDGVTIADSGWGFHATIPDMVESAAVIQSPMNARYGNTDGGMLSIVTSRGTNEFSGTIRRTFGRDMWKSDGIQYGDRTHQTHSVMTAPGDSADGLWYVTIKGPIWKDHITFAYASELHPTEHGSFIDYKSWSVPSQLTDAQSTYFKDPTTGVVTRAGDTGNMDGKYWQTTDKSSWNQLTVFYQVTNDHSFQASFTDYKHTWTDPGEGGTNPGLMNYKMMNWGGPSDYSSNGDGKTPRRIYNFSYRGILGNGNLLEVSWGKTNMRYEWPTSPAGNPSAAPIAFNLNQNNIQDPVTGDMRPINSLLEGWTGNTPMRYTNGIASDSGDAQTIDNLVIHDFLMAEWHGQHAIDLGAEMLDFKWDTQSLLDTSQYGFHTYGRLSTDPNVVGADNAGKYIVYPYNATVGDLTGGTDFNWPGLNLAANTPLNTINDWGINTYLIPRMYKQWGPDAARITTRTWSGYANDLWTLNDHYSVMAGLRFDKFQAQHALGTLYDYALVSPRFEFKWDVDGDQKRVLSLSYGKFHQKLPTGNFLPLGMNKWPYSAVYLWTGAANPDPNGTKPYLVDQAALTNPSNYTQLWSSQWMGGPNLKLDGKLRGPVSTQYELSLRRAYRNGGYLRMAVVYKSWENLYDWFASDTAMLLHTPETAGTDTQAYLSKTLKVDPNAHRNYKSFELEWNFSLATNLRWGGNYAYTRFTANDANDVVNSPDGSSKRTGVEQYFNWSYYLNTYVPLSVRNPEALRQGGSTFYTYFLLELNRAKVKQSVALRASYAQAGATSDNRPTTYNNTFNIPTPTIKNYDSTANLPSTINVPIEGAQQWMPAGDTYGVSLHYNLELPIAGKLAWFIQADVSGVFNHMSDGGYFVGVGYQDDWPTNGQMPATMAHGPRGGWDTRGTGGKFGSRAVSVESGFRF